ncbi:hypothetical protein SNEBB_008753 [Seison nebaliae]|nr:hypothetical protein SNEBB_008753 [Seison nebaliae]
MSSLNLLSFNCWGLLYVSKHRRKRIAGLAEYLASENYDMVGLQEIWCQCDFDLLKRRLQMKLPFSHYFRNGVLGSGCCIFSKHPIVETFFYSYRVNGQFEDVTKGDWYAGKGCGLAKIDMNDKIFNVYCTHLCANYSDAGSQSNDDSDSYLSHRLAQTYELSQFINFTSTMSNYSILFCDLNQQDTEIGYELLLNLTFLRDSFKLFSSSKSKDIKLTSINTCGCPNNEFTQRKALNRFPDGIRIDYIFLSESLKFNDINVTTQQIEADGISLSDHYGVDCSLQLNFDEEEFFIKKTITDNSSSVYRMNCANISTNISVLDIFNNHLLALNYRYQKYCSLLILMIPLIVFILSVPTFSFMNNFFFISIFIMTIIYLFIFLVIRLPREQQTFHDHISSLQYKLNSHKKRSPSSAAIDGNKKHVKINEEMIDTRIINYTNEKDFDITEIR